MWGRFRSSLEALARSRSRTFLLLCVAFVCGVAAHACWERPWPFFSYAAPAGAAAAGVLFWSRKVRREYVVVVAALACLVVGIWRYDSAFARSAYTAGTLSVPGTEFEGLAVDDPRVRIRDTVISASDVTALADGSVVPGIARIYARSPLEYRYGDRLRWSCEPLPLRADGGDGAADRMLLDGVRWTCFAKGNPQVLSRGGGDALHRALSSVRHAVSSAARNVLPEPEASFLLGLLIGDRDGLPDETVRAFRDVGVTHILAVSGYNVTQLIEVGVLLLALAAVPRRRSSAVMAAAVLLFAVLVGGDASVVRAAIMGCVGILAALYRRKYSGARSILAAAALMLAVNPLVLRHDVGFQLSFAAVWGLHALAPGVHNRIPARWRNALTRTASETLAATLATLPISLYVFGRVPLVGLPANMLILPFVPWAMLLGAAATGAGAANRWLAFAPAVIAAWILRAVTVIASSLARLFPMAIESKVSFAVAFLLFGWVMLLAFALARREKQNV